MVVRMIDDGATAKEARALARCIAENVSASEFARNLAASVLLLTGGLRLVKTCEYCENTDSVVDDDSGRSFCCDDCRYEWYHRAGMVCAFCLEICPRKGHCDGCDMATGSGDR